MAPLVVRQPSGWYEFDLAGRFQRVNAALTRITGYPEEALLGCISSLQFRRGGFLQEVQEALAEASLAPAHLELEVTESVLLDGVENSVELLRQLKGG